MQYDTAIEIAGRRISASDPTYFIADIAANHDGDLSRAKDLIHLAKEAGADAAKFQHFQARTIVSDFGFKNLGGQMSHQSAWKKSVFEIYQDASLNLEWTPILKETCDRAGITFFTSPYAPDLVDAVEPYVPAYKIGSGDITWLEIVEYQASKRKPVLLATGASTLEDVQRAVKRVLDRNPALALMQCNTNYTGSTENFKYINLKVLTTYQRLYPGMPLGLSDHTPGHTTVLGAIALGARIMEKHFTDDTRREGPDHKFSMDPQTWKAMVAASRELEMALGDGVKRVEDNERQTVVLQRRCLRLARDMRAGEKLTQRDVEALRPAPEGAVQPYQLGVVVGRPLARSKVAGDALYMTDLSAC